MNLPGPTQAHIMKARILERIMEQHYCELTQQPLVIENTYLVRVLGTGEELVISSHGLDELLLEPEEIEVFSAETGERVQ